MITPSRKQKKQHLITFQVSAEQDRLRSLREKVESQEIKLRRLRALRGQVNEHKENNNSLGMFIITSPA